MIIVYLNHEREVIQMYSFTIEKVSNYKNKGQAKEQDFRYHMTGQLVKADNIPATQCGDYEDIQIKSAKASVNENDIANSFAYITEDRTVYMMDRNEFEHFLNEFSYIDKDSRTNKTKIRIKNETKKMLAWLKSRA